MPNIDPFGTTFDPATASFNGRFLALTGDGLLTYRQVEGEAGNELVPDLAVDIPQISPNRKTYHFQLLPNIHYSNGKLVTASDVRYTFERVLRLVGPDTFGGIRGREILPPPALRSLRRNRHRQHGPNSHVPFVRSRPGLPLQARLHIRDHRSCRDPYARGKRRPIPGTGPYRMASFTPESVGPARPESALS